LLELPLLLGIGSTFAFFSYGGLQLCHRRLGLCDLAVFQVVVVDAYYAVQLKLSTDEKWSMSMLEVSWLEVMILRVESLDMLEEVEQLGTMSNVRSKKKDTISLIVDPSNGIPQNLHPSHSIFLLGSEYQFILAVQVKSQVNIAETLGIDLAPPCKIDCKII